MSGEGKARDHVLRLITTADGADAAAYKAVPPGTDEFASDDDPLSWDADGWEQLT